MSNEMGDNQITEQVESAPVTRRHLIKKTLKVTAGTYVGMKVFETFTGKQVDPFGPTPAYASHKSDDDKWEGDDDDDDKWKGDDDDDGGDDDDDDDDKKKKGDDDDDGDDDD